MTPQYPNLPLGIKSRFIPINDLTVHILEAEPPITATSTATKPPLIILLHGFPELAYSWRKILLPLSAAGYHAVAPDQRGYGHTTRTNTTEFDYVKYTDALAPFRMLNLAADIVSLVYALGYTTAAAVVGHDFGSTVAGHCALIRPDVFRSVVLMSAPYTGVPAPSPSPSTPQVPRIKELNDTLAALDPPRKHYVAYFSTPAANTDMCGAPQGIHAFLRAYYHFKSGDWAPNAPYPLPGPSASALAQLPLYYVMNLHESMPQTVERAVPAPSAPTNTWLTDAELGVYASVYERTGFQGGLNRYRCMFDAPVWEEDLRVFAGKRIEVPAMFVAGERDWGVFQYPGAVERMRGETCVDMREGDFVLVRGAGHWVQQEKPEAVVQCLIGFLSRQRGE